MWAEKSSWQVGKTTEGLASSRGMMSDPKVLFSHAILELHSWKRSPRRICFYLLNSFDVAFFPVFLFFHSYFGTPTVYYAQEELGRPSLPTPWSWVEVGKTEAIR